MKDWESWRDHDLDARADNAAAAEDEHARAGDRRTDCPVCGERTVIVTTEGYYAPDYGCYEANTELDAECGCDWSTEQYDALMERVIEEGI